MVALTPSHYFNKKVCNKFGVDELRLSYSTTICLLMSLSNPAISAGFDREVYALQVRLKIDGYYADETDGLSGPNFRNALKGYALEYGTSASSSSVSNHIANRAIQDEMRSPTKTELEKAHAAARDEIKDGPSARFRKEFAFDVGRNVVICGEINGKNSYGAYVGFSSYQATLTRLDYDAFFDEVAASGEVPTDSELAKIKEVFSDFYLSTASIGSSFTDHLCALGTSNFVQE